MAVLLLLPSVLLAESVDKNRAGAVADAFWQSSPLTRSSSGLELVFTSDMLDGWMRRPRLLRYPEQGHPQLPDRLRHGMSMPILPVPAL